MIMTEVLPKASLKIPSTLPTPEPTQQQPVVSYLQPDTKPPARAAKLSHLSARVFVWFFYFSLIALPFLFFLFYTMLSQLYIYINAML